ncbi:hypothetical protein YC2023_061098 [Brassica napus]
MACPGDPWDTSIPTMMVGTCITKGIAGERPIINMVNLQSRYPASSQRLPGSRIFTTEASMVKRNTAGERNIPEHVNRVSTGFQEGLKAFSTSPIIGEIRGTGLILATEFTENKSAHEPIPPEWGVGEYFAAECKKHGMIVRVAGDLIMMCPPLIISPEEINEVNYQSLIHLSDKSCVQFPKSLLLFYNLPIWLLTMFQLITIYGKALKAAEERVKELKTQQKK